MVSKLATITTLAAALLSAPVASAFTMGEAVATTGVHNTLAGTGSTNAAGTIGTVKRSLGAAAATKQGQLEKAGGAPIGWGGAGGGASGWAPGGGSGWATKGGGSGWATASSGWATGGAAGAAGWASGACWAGPMVAAK